MNWTSHLFINLNSKINLSEKNVIMFINECGCKIALVLKGNSIVTSDHNHTDKFKNSMLNNVPCFQSFLLIFLKCIYYGLEDEI